MKNFKISSRLYFLVMLAVSILSAALVFFLNYSFDALANERKMGLAQMDATAVAIFEKYHKLERDGAMTRTEAQAKAIEVIDREVKKWVEKARAGELD